MKKIFLVLLIPLILSILLIPSVMAHCPLCTAGAAAGVGVARFYGIHDSIVGLFLGAFIVSSALWFNKWLRKKVDIPFQQFFLVTLSFLLLAIPLYTAGIITNFEMVKSMPDHHSILGMGIYGIDSLLFGIITGTLLISAVFYLSDYIKEKQENVLFPYQGLVFMISSLAFFSLILWIIT